VDTNEFLHKYLLEFYQCETTVSTFSPLMNLLYASHNSKNTR